MDNVESFSYCGVTRLKMTSGDVITVEDTPEEILRVLNENKVRIRQ
nr:MAG TPA_asm: Flagellar and Swarming motility protein [Caudoviricetes sp.]